MRRLAPAGTVALALALVIPQAVGAAMATSTYTVRSFPGWGYDNVSPSDVSIAVGATQIVQTGNVGFTVYTKAGAFVSHTEFTDLFGVPSAFCIDPTTTYSASAQRFAIVCSDITTSNNTVRIAVSKTSNPAGGWYTWSTGGEWLDQPSVTIAKNIMVVTGSRTGSVTRVYQLSDLLSGVAHPRVVTLTLTPNVQRAVTELHGANTAYLVQAYPGSPVYLTTITGTPATGVTHTTKVLGTDTLGAPHEPTVPGGTFGGGDLDGRVLNAAYEVTTSGAKILQFSQMAACGTLDCIANNRITLKATGPAIGYLHTFSSTADMTYGAVTVDGAGQAFEAYTRSTPTVAPEAAIITTGLNTIVHTSASGSTACSSGSSPPCDERWGDYLGAAPDPTNSSEIWLSGLYQSSSGGAGFGTVITSVTVG